MFSDHRPQRWALLLIVALLLALIPVGSQAETGGQPYVPPLPELFLPITPTRADIIPHVIQNGDTIWDIADLYDITPQTVIWSNGWLEKDPHFILPGQELIIPPVSGVLYYVREGDTLPELAERFGVEADEVVAYRWNGLEDTSATLVVDQPLIFPWGRKPGLDPLAPPPSPPRIPIKINWPVRAGLSRGFQEWHRGIDIAAPAGRAVQAAAAGRVTYAGWSQIGYGNVIFLDHGYGVTTVYAHLKSFAVATGDSVAAGQAIGAVGSTGRSTGPHLHFEVRVNGRSRLPTAYLP